MRRNQETPRDESGRKKKYHRHTPYQIQALEASFKENPNTDDKQRLDLAEKLSLEIKQVNFWFQNRRTQMKTQLERHENQILQQEIKMISSELRILQSRKRRGGRFAAVVVEQQFSGRYLLSNIIDLRIANARLEDELNRLSVLANKIFLGRPLSSLAGPSFSPPLSNELAVGRNGFGGLGPLDAALPMRLT